MEKRHDLVSTGSIPVSDECVVFVGHRADATCTIGVLSWLFGLVSGDSDSEEVLF